MLKNKKVYKKRQLSYYVLMFLVTVNHFAHFGATFTSMRLFSGKKSLQLNEILKKSKTHLYRQYRIKSYAQIETKKKAIFFGTKKFEKTGF